MPSRAPVMALLHDLFLEALHERDDVALLVRSHLELRQRRRRVVEERAPVALADAHALMGELHAAAGVVHGPAGRVAQEVDEQLLLARHPVGAAVRPEPAELRIAL